MSLLSFACKLTGKLAECLAESMLKVSDVARLLSGGCERGDDVSQAYSDEEAALDLDPFHKQERLEYLRTYKTEEFPMSWAPEDPPDPDVGFEVPTEESVVIPQCNGYSGLDKIKHRVSRYTRLGREISKQVWEIPNIQRMGGHKDVMTRMAECIIFSGNRVRVYAAEHLDLMFKESSKGEWKKSLTKLADKAQLSIPRRGSYTISYEVLLDLLIGDDELVELIEYNLILNHSKCFSYSSGGSLDQKVIRKIDVCKAYINAWQVIDGLLTLERVSIRLINKEN